MLCDQPDGGGEQRRVIGVTDDGKHIGDHVGRQHKVGQRPDQRGFHMHRGLSVERTIVRGDQILGERQPRRERVQLSPGDWVLQNAGNSGVGRWVIAFAKERGLKTVSLVRRPEVVQELTAAGADVVLVDGEGAASRVAEATGHAKIMLALDGVAGNAMPSLTGSLSPGGTLVVYAFMSEQPGLANPRDIIFRGVTIRGFWLESPEIRNSPKLVEAIKAGARLAAEGKVRVPIAAVYPLTAAKEALAHALKSGKVLFQCS